VARAVPENGAGVHLNVPSLVVQNRSRVLGLPSGDVEYVLDACGLRLEAGRLLRPRTNELLLSKEFADALGVRVGDAIDRSIDEKKYFAIPTPMQVVGILESDPAIAPRNRARLAIASYEYLDSHERYRTRSPYLLVFPSQGRKAELDRWLEENVASSRTLVETYDARLRDLQQAARNLLLLLVGVQGIIAAVAVLALAILNLIFFTQRRDESGILHAVGHSRSRLVLRTTRETLSVVVGAWLIGAAMCLVSLLYSQATIYAPAGLSLDLTNLTPWLFTLPIPMAVVATSTDTIARTLAKLDPVSIVESRS
jgi:putative ABC transport system permease protein/lipoprotein-releasing system permease protein